MTFVCSRSLPYDSRITVSVGPNIPSKEGPIKQPQEETFSFKTVPVLAVSGLYTKKI